MDEVGAFIASLTPARLEMVAAVLILVSAGLLMMLGSLVMHVAESHALRRVRIPARKLPSAAGSSSLNPAEESETSALDVSERLSDCGALLSAPQIGLTKTQNSRADVQLGSAPASPAHAANRQRILDLWGTLRDFVERSTADSKIEATQRVEYAQEDRRDYLQLIQRLHSDGHLRGGLELWRRAYELSRPALSGRAAIAAATVREMEEIFGALSRPTEFESDLGRPGNVIKLRSKLPKSDEVWKINRIAAKSLEEDPYCIPAGTILSGKASTPDID